MSDTLIKVLGLVLGWGIVATGAAVFLFSLFRDRSRGRRRCPRCWYSMEGVPGLTCPECGRTARKERRFFRTRRRYRRALAAALLSVVGLGVLFTTGVILRGWVGGVPSSALVAFWPIKLTDWVGTGVPSGASSLRGSGLFYFNPLSPPPAAPPMPDWKQQLTDELIRRADEGELRHWQARYLAGRIKVAAAARGDDIRIIDFGELVSTDWRRDFPDPPSGTLGFGWVSGAQTSSARSIIESYVNAYPFDASLGIAEYASALFHSPSLGAGPHTSSIGPFMLWWNPSKDDDLTGVITAARAATPTSPAAVEPEQWDGRITLYRHLAETRVAASADESITGLFAAIEKASGVPVSVDLKALETAGVFLQGNGRILSLSGTVPEILTENLRWARDVAGVPVRWTTGPDGIEIAITPYLTPARSMQDRNLLHPIVRVYDLREILKSRLRASRATITTELSTLDSEIVNVGDPPGRWSFPHFLINGRLIVNAETEVHVALEEHFAECAKSFDGRVHDE